MVNANSVSVEYIYSCSTRVQLYCIFGCGKITDVASLSFPWIIHFWFLCLISKYKERLALYSEIKHKNQNWIIHGKLRVATSESEGKLSNPRGRAARVGCMKCFFENLRNPAHARCACAMHWFCRGQEYSTKFSAVDTAVPGYLGTRTGRSTKFSS